MTIAKDDENFWNTWFDNTKDNKENSSKSAQEVCKPVRNFEDSLAKFKLKEENSAVDKENADKNKSQSLDNIVDTEKKEIETVVVQKDESISVSVNSKAQTKKSPLESSTFATNITDSLMSAKGDWTNESVILPEGDLFEVKEIKNISADLNIVNDEQPADENSSLIVESDSSTLEKTLDSESTEEKETINTDREETRIHENETIVSDIVEKILLVTESSNDEQEDKRPSEGSSDSEIIKDDLQKKIRNSSSSSTIIPEEVTISNTSSSDSRAELSDSNQTIIIESELTNSVKNLLEDAMTEVNKDSNSTDSNGRSSIDVLKMDSGHTSADEIETTTSSDIEILSIPTPNGDKERVSASPVRQLMSKVVRRSSPPNLHQRSDSGSSFDSVGRQFVACQSLCEHFIVSCYLPNLKQN